MASSPSALTLSSISSRDRFSYTGSKTPSGIFFLAPAADDGRNSVVAIAVTGKTSGAAPNAPVAGRAAAAARPVAVLLRNSRRFTALLRERELIQFSSTEKV